MEITTPRLRAVAATIPLIQAEIENRAAFATLLRASVPENWPPESAADALPWFLERMQAQPDAEGWFAWYGLLSDADAAPALAAGGGFKGPPDAAGSVEIGYSALPQFQGRGLTGELVGGLVCWAFAHPVVMRIVADTLPSNTPSVRLLQRLGFQDVTAGSEPGSRLFELARGR